jgi:predicted amidohydrolase
MTELELESIIPWAPHPSAAPETARYADVTVRIAANGTRTCVGGWQLHYADVAPGQAYDVQIELSHTGLDLVRDSLQCTAHWGAIAPDDPRGAVAWEYLLLQPQASDRLRFARTLVAPEGASDLTLRYTFRWATQGTTRWQLPRITTVEAPPRPRPVRLCVATGKARERAGAWTVARNLAYYSQLCRAACRERPDLILLPEVALQWQVEGSPLDLAVEAPGPETDVFAQLAREHGLRIVLGLFERDGDAVFNSAVLIGPHGHIDGKYRKVHLAVLGESDSGVRPSDAFPVFETELGRLGCNICMDTSAAESSRILGLNGADIFLMPIMGDHRADRWTPGPPIYNESRWRAIMRTRAMDNQYAMAIARNETQGSCIIDRKGDILAWNEGDRDHIVAEVELQDGYRTWNNGCFRGVNWVQRRPHLYGAFVEEENWGNL